MKQRFPSLAGADRRRRSHLSALLLALVASGFAVPVGAQAPAAPIAALALISIVPGPRAEAQSVPPPPPAPQEAQQIRQELDKLRQEFEAIRDAYGQRLSALEARLSATTPTGPPAVAVPSHAVMFAGAFVPWIHYDDHPVDDRFALRFRTSLPQSLEDFVLIKSVTVLADLLPREPRQYPANVRPFRPLA